MKKHTEARSGPSQRQLRVGELVRHAMTEVLARGDLPEDVFAHAFVTIPEVRMSPDLKLATIFVTLHDRASEKPVFAALEKNRRMLRTEIAHRVNLKFAPEIRFRLDDRLDEVSKIDALLRSPEVQRDLARPRDPDDDEDGEA
ncbi:MAG: 30S ribosome-binding factor RbfA [Alsobacter sp.]